VKFTLLLYGDHEDERALSQAESMQIVEEHDAFGAKLAADRADVLGVALDGPVTA